MNSDEYSDKIYSYIQDRIKNQIDLTIKSDNNSNSRKMAEIIFNKNSNHLENDLTRMIPSEEMDIEDMFCMLLEILLYGINILTGGYFQLMDISDDTKEMIEIVSKYFVSLGYNIILEKKEIENNRPCLYRDRDDYYCEVTNRPPELLMVTGWFVLRYRIIKNMKFIKQTKLDDMSVMVITKNLSVYTIKFEIITDNMI